MNLLKLSSGTFINTDNICLIAKGIDPHELAVIFTGRTEHTIIANHDAKQLLQWADRATSGLPEVAFSACAMCRKQIPLEDIRASNYHINEQGDRICLNCLKGKHIVPTITLCDSCKGSGKLFPGLRPCPDCSGSGKAQP